MPSRTPFPQTALTRQLAAHAGLRDTDGAVTLKDVKRIYARTPDGVARLLPFSWITGAVNSGVESDVSGHSEFSGSDLREVNSWLISLTHYGSGQGARTRERLLRGNGYAFLAVAQGMDYFPDYARVPTVAAFMEDLRTSIAETLYRSASKPIIEILDAAGGWPETFPVTIPPLAAIVLDRAKTKEDIVTELMVLRDEFAPLRRQVKTLRMQLIEAESISARRSLLRDFQRITEELGGSEKESISISEGIDLSASAFRAVVNPADSGAWASLLKRPISAVSEWWRHRPYAILFRLDSKIPNLDKYGSLIAKHWGNAAEERISLELARYTYRVRSVMDQSRSASTDVHESDRPVPR